MRKQVDITTPSLRTVLLAALAGSSSQQPVDTDTLYKCGARKKVESALLEMYRENKVCCCLITKHSVQKSVWWIPGEAKTVRLY